MKRIMLAIAIVSLMVSCGESKSGKISVNQVVKIKMSNGDLDWIRLNSIEMKVFNVGDTIRVNRITHSMYTGSNFEKAAIISKIN